MSLPLGRGIVADPFMGSGSTIAACEAVGAQSIGVERFKDYFDMAGRSIPKLASVTTGVDADLGAICGPGELFEMGYAR